MRRRARAEARRGARRRRLAALLVTSAALAASALPAVPRPATSAATSAFAPAGLASRPAPADALDRFADRNVVVQRPDNPAWGSGRALPYAKMQRMYAQPAEFVAAVASAGCFLVGDSLLAENVSVLRAELTARFGASCAHEAWGGRRTEGAANTLLDLWLHTGLPPRVIVMAGANDIFDPPAFEREARRLLLVAGPAQRVIWVTPFASRRPANQYSAADERNSAYIDAVLAGLVKDYPNLVLVPWGSYFVGHPERVAALLYDGVHPNAEGRALLVNMLAQAWG